MAVVEEARGNLDTRSATPVDRATGDGRRRRDSDQDRGAVQPHREAGGRLAYMRGLEPGHNRGDQRELA